MDQMTCPKCGYSNPAEVTNCKQCKINLAWAIAEAPKLEEEKKTAELQRQAQEQQSLEERQRVLDELKVLYSQRPDMPLWEYTTVVILPKEVETVSRSLFAQKTTVGWESVETLFRIMGVGGWELVSVIAKTGSTEIKEGSIPELLLGAGQTVGSVVKTDYFVAIFKRSLPHSDVESVLADIQSKWHDGYRGES